MVDYPEKLNEQLLSWFDQTDKAVHRTPDQPTGIGNADGGPMIPTLPNENEGGGDQDVFKKH